MTTKLNFDKDCIAFNGPRTRFSLTANDGQEWILCRDDLQRISEGHFEFDDGREPIIADEEEQDVIVEAVLGQLSDINQGMFFFDVEPFDQHFKQHSGKYEPIEISDLGRYFTFIGEPYVFLGSRPRARKRVFAATNLKTDKTSFFSNLLMEKLLNKD